MRQTFIQSTIYGNEVYCPYLLDKGFIRIYGRRVICHKSKESFKPLVQFILSQPRSKTKRCHLFSSDLVWYWLNMERPRAWSYALTIFDKTVFIISMLSIENGKTKIQLMFNLIYFNISGKYLLQLLNLMSAESFIQVGTWTTKDCKLWNAPTPVWNFSQVDIGNRCIMIGCERGIPLRCSQARMGWGSTLCQIHDSLKDITTTTQEHLVKLLSVKFFLSFFFFTFYTVFTQINSIHITPKKTMHVKGAPD